MSYLDTFTRSGVRVSIQPNGNLRLEPAWLVTKSVYILARDHNHELVAEIRSNQSSVSSGNGEIVPDYHFLMVATNLDSWESDDPRYGYEVMLDACYRQLDAPYYAWLRHCMENARKSHDAESLDDAAFEAIRERFNVIHQWAVRYIGEQALKQAVRTTNVRRYVPPSEETFIAYRKTWDDAWNQYQQRHAAPGNAATSPNPLTQINDLLSTRGYAAIQSAVVDDIVVIVRDDTVVVPTKWTAKVRFSIDEINLLTDTSPETIKRIWEIKRTFGGTIVPADDCPFKDNEPGNERVAIQQSLFGTCA